jgi:hypothetical protein
MRRRASLTVSLGSGVLFKARVGVEIEGRSERRREGEREGWIGYLLHRGLLLLLLLLLLPGIGGLLLLKHFLLRLLHCRLQCTCSNQVPRSLVHKHHQNTTQHLAGANCS